jgi:GTPase SAR1 family protein
MKRLELPDIGYYAKQRVCNPCYSKLTERPSTLNNDKRQLASLKIVVLGDSACGKTSLIHRLIARSFNETYNATTGASFVSTGKFVLLGILRRLINVV